MKIVEKILNNERLETYEVKKIIEDECEDLIYIDEISGDDHRWQREVQYIFKIETESGDRYFAVDYMQGLTEHQEDDYFSQIAYEVKEEEITTSTWIKI